MRFGFNFILGMLVLAGLSGGPAFGQIVSDDFNAFNLKTNVWSFTDPLGDATLSLSGTNTTDATLSIAVPAGVTHELWTEGYNVPRIMQAAPNTDFGIQVKFESNLTAAFQMQGVVIEQDSANVMRIEFFYDGSNVNVFAASFADGFASPVTQINPTPLVGITPPMYLRVNRAGNIWTVSDSSNVRGWSVAGVFNHGMTVNKVGVYAGNSGSPAPAHTAIIDYFFNTASPIVPEDSSTTVADVVAPLIYDVKYTIAESSIHITWKTDEPATGAVEYGKTLSYEAGTVTQPGTSLSHTIDLTGLTSDTLYNFRLISNDNHPNNQRTTQNYSGSTLPAPGINVWYGPTQNFGQIGVPQRNADILGTVSGKNKITLLQYTLNGGAPATLSMGPDTRLLLRKGDFKINLPYAQLLNGANTVAISATDSLGVTVRDTVIVQHTAGKVWPGDYTVAWANPASLTDSAQVVDGKWVHETGGVRIVELGYDREIAIGDTTWSDYEVTSQFTVHGIDSTAEAFGPVSGGPAVGLMFRWKGHTTEPPFDPLITQPISGYLPFGAIGWYHWGKGFGNAGPDEWQLYGNNLALHGTDASAANAIHYGVKYNLKMRVNTIAGEGGFYSFKVWADGQPEPSSWLLTGQETLTDPQTGSFLLVAHHVDVTFGTVQAKKLAGDVTPPFITAQLATLGSHSAYISWTTNELATSKVVYGTTTAYGDTAQWTKGRSLAHGVPLTGLTASTLYHYIIESADSSGNVAVSADSTLFTLPPSPPSTIVSDEFPGTSLNTSVWTFINPNPPGGAALSKDTGSVTITANASVEHDLWTNGYQVPRIMQSVNNVDFDVQVKYVSPLFERFQSLGVVVEQDSANLMRIDFNTDGAVIKIFVATFTNGFASPVIELDSTIASVATVPLYMRIKRETSIWTVMYSLNGLTWTSFTPFYHAMTMSKIGLFAGNVGSPAPENVAIFDYFRSNVAPGVTVNIKAILQGPFVAAGDSMRTSLTAFLPKKHPYGGAPFSYTGTDSVNTIPAGVVDWVLLELRTGTASSTKFAARAAFLKKDGSIVDLDGTNPVTFPGVPAGYYRVVVRHRNHLAVMSKDSLSLSAASALYDFTTAMTRAYSGGANPMVSVGGKFCLFAANGNGDGAVNATDRNTVWRVQNGMTNGYYTGDFDLSAAVNATDKNIFWRVNNGAISQVP